MFEYLQLMAAKKQPALRGEAATHGKYDKRHIIHSLPPHAVLGDPSVGLFIVGLELIVGQNIVAAELDELGNQMQAFLSSWESTCSLHRSFSHNSGCKERGWWWWWACCQFFLDFGRFPSTCIKFGKKGSGIGITARTNLKTGNRLLSTTEPGTGFLVPFTCGTRIKIFEKQIRTRS